MLNTHPGTTTSTPDHREVTPTQQALLEKNHAKKISNGNFCLTNTPCRSNKSIRPSCLLFVSIDLIGSQLGECQDRIALNFLGRFSVGFPWRMHFL